MKPDRSWKALLSPGDGIDHFLTESPLQPFVATAKYHSVNALYCSELSRLVYKNDEGERRAILKRANLYEVKFFSKAHTQAMLVEGEGFYILAFRGTSEKLDWITNARAVPARWSTGGKIHKGFGAALLLVWPKIERYLGRLDHPVFLTGHSLGAALTLLAATLYKPDGVYTFGCPRVGDGNFLEALEAVPVYRIVNGLDVVPNFPFLMKHKGELRWLRDTNERLPRAWSARKPSSYAKELPPPRFLSDHAPVNYSCALERLL